MNFKTHRVSRSIKQKFMYKSNEAKMISDTENQSEIIRNKKPTSLFTCTAY